VCRESTELRRHDVIVGAEEGWSSTVVLIVIWFLSRWLLLFLQDFEDEQFKKFEISSRKRDVRASLADREGLLLVRAGWERAA
jgi:hypothetical protein